MIKYHKVIKYLMEPSSVIYLKLLVRQWHGRLDEKQKRIGLISNELDKNSEKAQT